jgi:hypothetical protein
MSSSIAVPATPMRARRLLLDAVVTAGVRCGRRRNRAKLAAGVVGRSREERGIDRSR